MPVTVAKPITGENIVLKVGDPAGSRTVPSVLEEVVGTSTGYKLGEREVDTREFGVDSSLWDDGAVTGKNWSMSLSMNYRPDVAGNALIESTALTSSELYVEFFPQGEVSGAPKFSGFVTCNGFGVDAPRDNLLTSSGTLQGRGPLTKESVV